MDFLIALVPSVGVLFLFWLAVRGMLSADQRERAAAARYEADLAARAGTARKTDAEDGR